ncbi:MAG: hypothetical protein KBC81_01015, partial [Candidatus Pacebacteria bacterium]|nr:hypothetical protein [Candidatus Paceibacterota bacterium]
FDPEHQVWWYSFEFEALEATTLWSVGFGLGVVILMLVERVGTPLWVFVCCSVDGVVCMA